MERQNLMGDKIAILVIATNILLIVSMAVWLFIQ
jgi:hypothetical protein